MLNCKHVINIRSCHVLSKHRMLGRSNFERLWKLWNQIMKIFVSLRNIEWKKNRTETRSLWIQWVSLVRCKRVIYTCSCRVLSKRVVVSVHPRFLLRLESRREADEKRTPSRQLIRDTMLDNARECRSSSESAANGSQLISVYYSTGVRARGLESVRKYGRTGSRPRPQRGERKLLLHTPNTLSAFSGRWPSKFILKVLGSSGRLVARWSTKQPHRWRSVARSAEASTIQFYRQVRVHTSWKSVFDDWVVAGRRWQRSIRKWEVQSKVNRMKFEIYNKFNDVNVPGDK